MIPIHEDIEIFGTYFKVVEPASIGFPRHSTDEFKHHEPVLQEWVEGIRPGDIVIDGGASFGNYTLPALAKGAYAICYEPYHEHAACLRHNISCNGWLGRALVRPVGLWDGTPYPQGILKQLEMPADMPTVRLDDEMGMFGLKPPKPFRKGWPKDLQAEAGSRVHLKLDIEGTELGAIQGGLKLIEMYKPRIIIEDHQGVDPRPECEISNYPVRVQSRQNIDRILTDFGYNLKDVPFDVSRHYLVATHPGML